MIRFTVLVGVACGMMWSAPAQAAQTLTVTSDRSSVTTQAGSTTFLPIAISNTGSEPSGPLVAHLLVVDPASDGSADAEDWTGQLTRRIESIAAGATTDLSWDIKPIKTGEYFVMIAVTPLDPGETPPVLSPNIVFDVSPPGALAFGSVIAVSSLVPLTLITVDSIMRRRQRRRLGLLSGAHPDSSLGA